MALPIFKKKEPAQSENLPKIGSILAVAAGKGGVGKSTITVNLAHALQSKGYRVGIMDTDIYGPSIRKMLPEDQLPVQKGNSIQPALCKGIKMISMAYFRKENEAAAVRAPIANSLITHFIKNVEWGTLDYLLIDFPPGTGDIQLTLSQHAGLSGAIMVTTPQEVALLDVRKAMALFEQVKIPILGIVENMSYFDVGSSAKEVVYVFGKGGGKKLAREAGVPFLGEIPLDPCLCAFGDQGKSLFIEDPEFQKNVTGSFQRFAQQVVEHNEILALEKKDALLDFELVWREMP